MKQERSSGILLHPTSLPGKYGIGTLGNAARTFVDFLAAAGQKWWQILPLGPTGYGDSPYMCFSSKAGNPYLIDMDLLAELDLLRQEDLIIPEGIADNKVEYGIVIEWKTTLLKKAQQTFIAGKPDPLWQQFETFCAAHQTWLDDYAFFMALKEKFDKRPWYEWEENYRNRNAETLTLVRHELENEITFHKFVQFLFAEQWYALKKYANEKGIGIIGDIPIYVAMDSVDTWIHTQLFQFDENKNPVYVGGCPPDYFSETGQLWGNPIYDYEKMAGDNFAWWTDRMQFNLHLYDLIRVDHFRGFAGYWRIPYGEPTAINGKWIDGPGKKLFDAIQNALGEIPIIAEDLGLITPDVIALRDHYQLPGMKILQFAFDSAEENDYLPHTYNKNCIVYTGTHDNDTIVGWFNSAKQEDKNYVLQYLHTGGEKIHEDFIRAAWASVAYLAIAPMQDLLGLGNEARMNLPGTTENNWQWRMLPGDANELLAEKMAALTKLYGR